MKINWGIKIRRALFCENKDYQDSSGEDKLYIDGKKVLESGVMKVTSGL